METQNHFQEQERQDFHPPQGGFEMHQREEHEQLEEYGGEMSELSNSDLLDQSDEDEEDLPASCRRSVPDEDLEFEQSDQYRQKEIMGLHQKQNNYVGHNEHAIDESDEDVFYEGQMIDGRLAKAIQSQHEHQNAHGEDDHHYEEPLESGRHHVPADQQHEDDSDNSNEEEEENQEGGEGGFGEGEQLDDSDMDSELENQMRKQNEMYYEQMLLAEAQAKSHVSLHGNEGMVNNNNPAGIPDISEIRANGDASRTGSTTEEEDSRVQDCSSNQLFQKGGQDMSRDQIIQQLQIAQEQAMRFNQQQQQQQSEEHGTHGNETSDDEIPINDMQAKFNQILANFDEGHKVQLKKSKGGSGTVDVLQKQRAKVAAAQGQSLSNELTMKAVGGGGPTATFGADDALNDFKTKNFKQNLQHIFDNKQAQQNNFHQEPASHLQAQAQHQQLQQHEHQVQVYNDEEGDSEDKENNEAINIMIGNNNSFFPKKQLESSSPPVKKGSKPPMPQKDGRLRAGLPPPPHYSSNHLQVKATKSSSTPERKGMIKQSQTTNAFQMPSSSSAHNLGTGHSKGTTFTSYAPPASSAETVKEKQQRAAQLRQNALRYGNSVGRRNLSSQTRPKTASSSIMQQPLKKAMTVTERRAANEGEVKQTQKRSLVQMATQRPQTAKIIKHERTTGMPMTSQTPRHIAGKASNFSRDNNHIAPQTNRAQAKPQVTQVQRRPQTATTSTLMFASKPKKQPAKLKKNDPVSRYQNLKNEWSKQKFLKQSGSTGRKLELDRFNKWRQLADSENSRTQVKKGKDIQKKAAQNAQAKPMACDRRDDLRYHLRAKISQKDYVDKEMKHFHYASNQIINGVPAGQQQLQQLQQLQQMQQMQVEQQQLQQVMEEMPPHMMNLEFNGQEGYGRNEQQQQQFVGGQQDQQQYYQNIE